MKLDILKKIAGSKTNFSILSRIHVDGDVATVSDMDYVARTYLPRSFKKGMYTYETLLRGIAGETVSPYSNDADFPDVLGVSDPEISEQYY